jgi:ankyrin repeat protein
VVHFLIEQGAKVNCPGGKYGFPLQAAVCDTSFPRSRSQAWFKVVELLLEKGANVNQEGGKYGTALQAAAYHHRTFVEMLLKHGADPNIRGGKFGSPLKAAKKKGLNRVVKLLVQYGAKDHGEQGS